MSCQRIVCLGTEIISTAIPSPEPAASREGLPQIAAILQRWHEIRVRHA
ncbi:MAG TPA: hypothetical protein VJ603_01825 [Paucimonas sp.]|nr:hypothetical protein [Paucimonas sp.]HJW55492.1 hypothetical protein [Burkholderiaceae bacterium]